MAELLQTITVSEKPQVLIVGEPGVVRAEISAIVSQNELGAVEAHFNDNIHGEYYKAILVIEQPEAWQKSRVEEWYRKLQAVSSQVMIILALPSIIESSAASLKLWQQESAAWEQLVSEVDAVWNQAEKVLLQEVASRRHPLVGVLLDQIGSGEVVLPDVEGSFIDLAAFGKRWSASLLVPWRDHTWKWYQGQGKGMRQFGRAIASRYENVHQHGFSVEYLAVTEPTLPVSPEKIVVKGENQVEPAAKVIVPLLPADIAEPPAKAQPEEPELPKPSTKTSIAPQTTPEPPRSKVIQPVSPISRVAIPPTKPIRITQPAASEQRPKGTRPPVKPITESPERASSRLQPDPREHEVKAAVQRLFEKKEVEHKVEKAQRLAQQTTKISKKSKRKKAVFGLGIVVSAMATALLVMTAVFFVSSWMVNRQLQATAATLGTELHQAAVENLERKSTFLGWQLASYQPLIGAGLFYNQQAIHELSETYVQAAKASQELETNGVTTLLAISGSKPGDVFLGLSALGKKAGQIYQDISLLQAAFEEDAAETEDPERLEQVQAILAALETKRKSLAVFQQVEPLLPEVLGQGSRRTYAVLLQDNQELRPTGGFIQAVALISLEDGGVVDSEVYSVYTLDDAFSGTVAAPNEIKQFLGEERLYLRDANWNPDFEQSGKQMEVFIEQATGKQIDGIVGINLFVLQDLIAALGPVDVPQFNEVVTDRNLWERAEFHSEVQLVDSKQDQEYLPVVFEEVLGRVRRMSEDTGPGFLETLYRNIDAHQVSLYFTDQGQQASFSALGWTGELLHPECPVEFASENCVVDPMMMVESNVGVNKANYTIKRDISNKVVIEDGAVSHHRTVQYINSAKTNAWPRGTYRTYVRFYVDPDSQLDALLINGQEVPPAQVSQQVRNGRVVWGVLFEVPISSEATLELKYTRPLEALETPDFAYAFFEQQQPGRRNAVDLQFTHPATVRPTVIAPQATVTGNTISFEVDDAGHHFVGAAFSSR